MNLFKRKPKWFVLKYCQVEKRNDPAYKWYAFDPAVIYPETILRILAVIESGEIPEELVDNQAAPGVDPRSVAFAYANAAKELPAEGWHYALTDRDQFIDPQQITVRANALTLARRWFTQALHCAVGQAVGVHIYKDDKYRL